MDVYFNILFQSFVLIYHEIFINASFGDTVIVIIFWFTLSLQILLHTTADYLYNGNISSLLVTPIQQLDIDAITPTHLNRYHILTNKIFVKMNDENVLQHDYNIAFKGDIILPYWIPIFAKNMFHS